MTLFPSSGMRTSMMLASLPSSSSLFRKPIAAASSPPNHDLPLSLSHPIEKFIWTGRSGGVGSVARCGSGPGVPWRQCAEISHSASKGKNDTAARAWHNCLFVSGDVRINRGCFESWSVEMDRLWSTAMQSSELPVPLSRHRGEVM